MSLFGRIANRIFGRSSYQETGGAQAATPDSAMPTPAGAPPATGSVMGGGAMGGATLASGSGAGSATIPAMGSAGAPASGGSVDVEAVLTDMASKNPQKLNWRTSIVDLMKLLDLDASLAARQELATELGYTGAKDGSAEMNIWLHKQVMRKLAENGGHVPASLRD